ncbi:ferredoxin [Flavitalea flava]
MPTSIKERYPLNKGDFYINNGDCITCGAPQAEAPDLIEHAENDGHCYFKKQPESEAELDEAISAMMVSCISALRYGGTDEKILRRLFEDGMADLCDKIPERQYPVLVRDRVSFNFEGLIIELANLLIAKFTSLGSHVIIDGNTCNQTNHFSFVNRWSRGARGILYDCKKHLSDGYTLQISGEKGKIIESTIGLGSLLHDFLKVDSRITNIKWFARNTSDDIFYDKPY